jgi:two-component system, chemotaxis family, sensor kinase CheA
MNAAEIERKINEFSTKFINYEDGNLILLSELIDDLNGMNDETCPDISKIFCAMTNMIKKIIANETVDSFRERISEGIDIFSRIIKDMLNNKSDEIIIKENIRENLELYMEKNKDYCIPAGNRKVEKTQAKSVINLNSELMNIFLTDCDERLIQAEECILELEKDFNNKETIDILFRIFHTIKGECGFLKIASLGEVTHNIENLLDLIRKKEMENDENVIEILLSGIDCSKSILDALKKGDITIFNQIDIDPFVVNVNSMIMSSRKTIGEILKEEGVLSESDVVRIMQKQKETSYTKKFGEIAVEQNMTTEEEIKKTIEKQKSRDNFLSEKNNPVIKVKSSQINFLVDMIGELMTIENQFDEKDKNVVQLKKITKSIQNSAMQLRTVKIKNLFINTKRTGRDVAKTLEKDIDIATYGDDLEIDRNLVEILEEPLLHIIRNSCYHGIESREERSRKNKSATGNILLSAERKGNNIVVSVRDDGAGLDDDKIIGTAIERGLVSRERSKSLSRSEIYNFILLPGFSTVKNADAISGRGVGMDIVKNIVTRARGRLELKSEPGRYTETSLIFPLSLAIIDGMIVRNKENYFIVPVSFIVEALKINQNMLMSIENKSNVIHLRNEIIPAIDIGDYFYRDCKQSENKIAVIVKNNEKKYGLLVDEIITKKEIVIKSLGNKFRDLRGISSCAILQDGEIGYVLDVEAMIAV